MFSIGIGEIVLILLAALLFIKPEDMPKLFRGIGNIYGTIKKMNSTFVKTIQEADKQVKSAATLNVDITKKLEDPFSTGSAANNKNNDDNKENNKKEETNNINQDNTINKEQT